MLAAPLAAWLESLAVPQPYSSYGATGLVVVTITYFPIVVGELVPKRIGQTYPETLARLVARPISGLAIATMPFVKLLSMSTHALLRLLGVKDNGGNAVTEEEIHAMLAEGTTAGVIESHEHTMVRNVFRLDDRQIGSLMVPRGNIVVLDIDLPFEVNRARIEASDPARFPVVRGGLDPLQGVADARQWLSRAMRDGARELRDPPLEQPLYVPETLTGMGLLDNFQQSHVQMAFAIGEYGEVQGLVTPQDVVEAIAGGLMLMTGRLPKVADAVDWDGWHFEIVDMDGKTIDKVLASRRSAAEPVEDGTDQARP